MLPLTRVRRQIVGRFATFTQTTPTAIVDAVREEHDFSGWLAQILATAAAELGLQRRADRSRPSLRSLLASCRSMVAGETHSALGVSLYLYPRYQ
jgi:hypothetical protein